MGGTLVAPCQECIRQPCHLSNTDVVAIQKNITKGRLRILLQSVDISILTCSSYVYTFPIK